MREKERVTETEREEMSEKERARSLNATRAALEDGKPRVPSSPRGLIHCDSHFSHPCARHALCFLCGAYPRYDLVITHALEWPSLTAQWLPNVSK